MALNFYDETSLPIAGAGYVIAFESGKQIKGQLDENGYAFHKNVPDESSKVTYILPEPFPEEPWPSFDELDHAISTSFH